MQLAKQKSKTLMIDARCIRLIELFGAYSVSEQMHGVAWCMHEFAWHMQRVHGECMELHGACEGCRVNAWSCMSHAKTVLSC